MPFLPEELCRAQERPRHFLPADDIGPLIDQDGKVAPGLDPLRVERADDRFRRRAHDERLGELLIAAARDPGHLRRKSLDVLLLFHQQAGRDEQREVSVDVARRLEAAIEPLLNQLPDGVAVRPDGHAALDLGVVRQLRPPDDIEIPAGEVLRLRRDLGHHRFFLHAWAASLPSAIQSPQLPDTNHQSAIANPSLHNRQSPIRQSVSRSVTRRFQCISSRSG